MRTSNHRSPREIRRDLRAYLGFVSVARAIGNASMLSTYIKHVQAMERELELVRTGRVLTF